MELHCFKKKRFLQMFLWSLEAGFLSFGSVPSFLFWSLEVDIEKIPFVLTIYGEFLNFTPKLISFFKNLIKTWFSIRNALFSICVGRVSFETVYFLSKNQALIGLSKIGIQSQLLEKVKILVTNSDMVLIICVDKCNAR